MDTSGHATAIYDRLEETFGSSEVFLDTARMQAGSRWQEETRAQLESCELCLVIIGRQWAPEQLGNREDIVRLELETALNHNKALIPILVENAALPRVHELPPSLSSLPSWQAAWLNHRSYGEYKRDLNTLVDRIRALFMQRGVYGIIRVYGFLPVSVLSRMFSGSLFRPNPSIVIDGSPVTEIGPKEILAFQIPVGPHTVQAVSKDLQSELMAYQMRRNDFRCLRCYMPSTIFMTEEDRPELRLEDVSNSRDTSGVRRSCIEDPPTKRFRLQSGTLAQ